MKIEVNAGLITNATNREELNTMISVIGRYFMNSPIIPGQIASGINAASVVAVEAIIGQATSPTPYLAASNALMPSSSISRYIFSTTTIPLSTSIPSAKTKEKSTITLKVIPIEFRIMKDINIDNGIATPTKSAFLNPRKNSNTPTTRITPKMIEF